MGTGTLGSKPPHRSPDGSLGRPASNRAMPRRSRSPGRPVSLFGRAAVSSSRPCESGTGVARRGGQGRAQARPKGLSLTAPSTAPGLGAVGTPERSLRLAVGEPVRPSIKHRDWRPSNSVSRLYNDPFPIFAVKDLTMTGHDFAATLENNTVWAKLKSAYSPAELAGLPIRLVQTIASDLLVTWAKSKVGL